MTVKNYTKAFKQLSAKSVKMKKFEKHNAPKKKTTGIGLRRCRLCGRFGAHIRSYGLNMCRQCFRDNAQSIGFKKYD